MKNLFWTALFLVTLGQCTVTWGQSAPPFSAVQTRKTPLFVEREVQRFGLTRSWFNQISVDQKRYSVKHVLLQDGTLFAVSDDAQLHAIDAETGATLWVAELGDQGTVCMAPAANSRMVAVLGGTNLQIFDRITGRKLWENQVSGTPGAGCALSERHVYLPLISGRILAWPLEEAVAQRLLPPEIEDVQAKVQPKDDHERVLVELSSALDEIRASLREKAPPVAKEPFRLKPPTFIPMECQSFGETLIQPIITRETETDEYLVWPTVRGDVYFSCIGETVKNVFTLLYRVRIAPQAFSFDSVGGISVDWVAPRTVLSQAIYSPQQVLPKEISSDTPEELQEEGKGEAADPFAVKSNVQSKFAAPQDFDFGDEEEEENVFSGGFDEEEEEQPLPKPTRPSENVLAPEPAENTFQDDLTASIAESDEEIIPSMILVGNVAGFVAAINDSNGELLWKFIATHPVIERVIIVKNHVYACALRAGMYCLNAKNGDELWYTEGIVQFIAESNHYVYALNSRREIAILDRKTGQVQTTIPVMPFDFFLDNYETDRIYAGTNNGLFQCLHEIPLTDPLKHRLNRMDLAEQLQTAIAETREQQPIRRPPATPSTVPTSVPDFGGGFDSSEESPFGGTDEDFPSGADENEDEDEDSGFSFGDE